MIDITREPIDVARVLNAVENPAAGGVAVFIGRVRNHADGKDVLRMEYEGYESMARKVLEKLEADIRQRWPVLEMAMVHRLGLLELGEASVVIAIACAHRDEAFAACRYAIDTLKKTIPIWKKEYGVDGTNWVDGVIPEMNISEEGEEK